MSQNARSMSQIHSPFAIGTDNFSAVFEGWSIGKCDLCPDSEISMGDLATILICLEVPTSWGALRDSVGVNAKIVHKPLFFDLFFLLPLLLLPKPHKTGVLRSFCLGLTPNFSWYCLSRNQGDNQKRYRFTLSVSKRRMVAHVRVDLLRVFGAKLFALVYGLQTLRLLG